MIRLFLASLLIAVSYAPTSFANTACSSALSGNAFYQTDAEGLSVEATTERFLGYLGSLFESGALRVDALVDLKNQLENGSSELSIFSEAAGIVDEVHRDELQRYLDQKQFDDSKVIAWLEQAIAQTNQVAEEKDSVSEETQRLFEPIRFARIDRDEVWLGPYSESVVLAEGMIESGSAMDEIITEVEKLATELSNKKEKEKDQRRAYDAVRLVRKTRLLQDFEIMDAPVTVGQWYEVMGYIPEQDSKAKQSDSIEIGFESIAPNHAMTNVNWWGALLFANRLSVLHGYQPVYSFKMRGSDEVTFNPVEGEVGQHLFKGDVEYLVVDAPGGDIYRAEGYRLPTHLESEILLRNGKSRIGVELQFAEALVEESEYYEENKGVRAPVYQYKTTSPRGDTLFSVHNNTQEWMFDIQLWSSASSTGVFDNHERVSAKTVWENPVGGLMDIEQSVEPGEHDKKHYDGFMGERGVYGRALVKDGEEGVARFLRDIPNRSQVFTGFRLVRSLPNTAEVGE